MWGGRYEGVGPDDLFRAANDSLPIDWRLVQQDIEGSIAWAGALCSCGVLSTSEHGQLVQALEALKILAGVGTDFTGRLLLLDALSMDWQQMRFKRDPQCAVCGTATA